MQTQVYGRTAYITLTWVASDTGAKITAVVDSVAADSGLSIEAALDSARGSRWTGLRHPSGRVTDLSGGPSSLIGDQVRDEIRLLFPLLPPEGARLGATWTDTTTGPTRVSAFEAVESARVDSHADAQMTADGALPLSVTRARTAAGQGTQFGQPITLRATGSDTFAYKLSVDGRVLAVTGIRLTDLVVDLPSIGQSVPARESSSLRMSLLR